MGASVEVPQDAPEAVGLARAGGEVGGEQDGHRRLLGDRRNPHCLNDADPSSHCRRKCRPRSADTKDEIFEGKLSF